MIALTRLAAGSILSLAALATPATAQDTTFARGELSSAKNHSGDIWLNELSAGDSVIDAAVAVATYAPGAVLDWHAHPGGQVLVITEGEGFYQERGKPSRIVHKGDVIRSMPGVEHWHGATPTSPFAYFAVTPTQKGKTIWLKPVTKAEYAAVR
ncbi:quercetin dioxygenase-like cupin family protein [Sphingomonas endophytica]|uniref:Quercetin dioxygenase-like cupin family protein n=1 Tax=Sphingomonas endophytica TaxID=869719 RepID=A0A7X0JA74_9SPHN|nr:cupin domain-containing protein [Sphingomonas endophytica]MBB6503890.1 quercetin dioxygenase-like cupin family protein [Sphingomonas endophytica]